MPRRCLHPELVAQPGAIVHRNGGSRRAGVDERWADIAPALQSLAWNGMAGCEEHFLTGYGIPRDPEKLSRYLARWNAG